MLNVNIYAKKRMKLIFVFVFLLISACCFSEGLTKVQDENGKWIYIDKEGTFIRHSFTEPVIVRDTPEIEPTF